MQVQFSSIPSNIADHIKIPHFSYSTWRVKYPTIDGTVIGTNTQLSWWTRWAGQSRCTNRTRHTRQPWTARWTFRTWNSFKFSGWQPWRTSRTTWSGRLKIHFYVKYDIQHLAMFLKLTDKFLPQPNLEVQE